jgi:hypothetical protein
MTRYDVKDKLAYGPQSKLMVRFLAKLDRSFIAYNGTVDSDGYRFVENAGDGLRFVGNADKVAKDADRARLIDHKGWFIDEYQDETICGKVYQLPARNGECRYLAAVSDAFNAGCSRIDFGTIYSDPCEAAIAGDRQAEMDAEAEREYQRIESAKMRIEDITDEIKSAYVACRALCAEVRANCQALDGLTAVRGLIRAEVRRVRQSVRKLYKERAELMMEVA